MLGGRSPRRLLAAARAVQRRLMETTTVHQAKLHVKPTKWTHQTQRDFRNRILNRYNSLNQRGVLQVLEDMHFAGEVPTTATYNLVLELLCLSTSELLRVRKWILPPGIEPPDPRNLDQKASYTVSGRQSLLIYKQMVANGVKPNYDTFELLLLTCLYSKQGSVAMEVFEEMVQLQEAKALCAPPTERKIGKNMVRRVKSGANTQEWFAEDTAVESPEARTAPRSAGDGVDGSLPAEEVVQVEVPFRIHLQVYDMMLRCLHHSDRRQGTEGIERVMGYRTRKGLSPVAGLQLRMAKNYAQMGDVDEVHRIVGPLMSSASRDDRPYSVWHCYATVMTACLHARDLERAVSVLDSLRSLDLQVPNSALNIYYREVLRLCVPDESDLASSRSFQTNTVSAHQPDASHKHGATHADNHAMASLRRFMLRQPEGAAAAGVKLQSYQQAAQCQTPTVATVKAYGSVFGLESINGGLVRSIRRATDAAASPLCPTRQRQTAEKMLRLIEEDGVRPGYHLNLRMYAAMAMLGKVLPAEELLSTLSQAGFVADAQVFETLLVPFGRSQHADGDPDLMFQNALKILDLATNARVNLDDFCIEQFLKCCPITLQGVESALTMMQMYIEKVRSRGEAVNVRVLSNAMQVNALHTQNLRQSGASSQLVFEGEQRALQQLAFVQSQGVTNSGLLHNTFFLACGLNLPHFGDVNHDCVLPPNQEFDESDGKMMHPAVKHMLELMHRMKDQTQPPVFMHISFYLQALRWTVNGADIRGTHAIVNFMVSREYVFKNNPNLQKIRRNDLDCYLEMISVCTLAGMGNAAGKIWDNIQHRVKKYAIFLKNSTDPLEMIEDSTIFNIMDNCTSKLSMLISQLSHVGQPGKASPIYTFAVNELGLTMEHAVASTLIRSCIDSTDQRRGTIALGIFSTLINAPETAERVVENNIRALLSKHKVLSGRTLIWKYKEAYGRHLVRPRDRNILAFMQAIPGVVCTATSSSHQLDTTFQLADTDDATNSSDAEFLRYSHDLDACLQVWGIEPDQPAAPHWKRAFFSILSGDQKTASENLESLTQMASNERFPCGGSDHELAQWTRMWNWLLRATLNPDEAARHYRNPHLPFALFAIMKSDPCLRPDINTYNILIRATAIMTEDRSGDNVESALNQASSVYRQLLEDGLTPTLDTLRFLMLSYGQGRDADGGIEIWEALRGVVRDEEGNIVSQDKPVPATELLWGGSPGEEPLTSTAILPVGETSHEAFYAVLQSCTKSSQVDRLAELFRTMKFTRSDWPPKVHSYTSLMSAYVIRLGKRWLKLEQKDTVKAIHLFELMQRDGIKPNGVVYNILISSFASIKDQKGALESFRMMILNMDEFESLRPKHHLFQAPEEDSAEQQQQPIYAERNLSEASAETVVTLRNCLLSLLNAFHVPSHMGGQEEMMQQLRDAYVPLDEVRVKQLVYTSLIDQYATVGDVSNALQVKDFMKVENVPIDAHVYASVINACTIGGDIESAFKMVEEMNNEVGMYPTQNIFTTLIKGCNTVSHIDRAFMWLLQTSRPGKQRHSRGLLSVPATYNRIIDAYAWSFDVGRAFEVYDQMLANEVAPDVTTFVELIYACGRCGEIDRAFHVVREVIPACSTGELQEATNEVYTELIVACINSATPHRAFEAWEYMQSRGITPTVKTFRAILDACIKTGDPDRAFALFNEMQTEHFYVFGEEVYIDLINACNSLDQKDLATQALEMMREAGIEITGKTYLALMKGCKTDHNFAMGVEVIDLMEQHESLQISYGEQTQMFNMMANLYFTNVQRCDESIDVSMSNVQCYKGLMATVSLMRERKIKFFSHTLLQLRRAAIEVGDEDTLKVVTSGHLLKQKWALERDGPEAEATA